MEETQFRDIPPELYPEFAEYMDDVTLGRFMSTNIATERLTADEMLWRTRSELQLSQLLPFRRYYLTWREFYTKVRSDSYYVVRVGRYLAVFNHPNEAYNALLAQLYKYTGLTVDTFDPTTYNFPGFFEILLLLDSHISRTTDADQRDIFRIKANDHKLTDITKYPVLTPSNYVIAYQPTARNIVVGRLEDIFLSQLRSNIINRESRGRDVFNVGLYSTKGKSPKVRVSVVPHADAIVLEVPGRARRNLGEEYVPDEQYIFEALRIYNAPYIFITLYNDPSVTGHDGYQAFYYTQMVDFQDVPTAISVMTSTTLEDMVLLLPALVK